MSMHLWEAVRDAEVRSDPLFVVDPATVEAPPPSLQRVLLAAATLWCRTLTWPTVREISTTAAVAASTSISAVGTPERPGEVLVESELWTIVGLASDRVDNATTKYEALRRGVTARVRRLAAIDPALARLPLVAGSPGTTRRWRSKHSSPTSKCRSKRPLPMQREVGMMRAPHL